MREEDKIITDFANVYHRCTTWHTDLVVYVAYLESRMEY
jgi:hypothetical protein